MKSRWFIQRDISNSGVTLLIRGTSWSRDTVLQWKDTESQHIAVLKEGDDNIVALGFYARTTERIEENPILQACSIEDVLPGNDPGLVRTVVETILAPLARSTANCPIQITIAKKIVFDPSWITAMGFRQETATRFTRESAQSN